MGVNGSGRRSAGGGCIDAADDPEVLELIDRAGNHPLGTDFLVHGCLESVAASFGVHAFLVDKARESFPPPPLTPAIGLMPDESEWSPKRRRPA